MTTGILAQNVTGIATVGENEMAEVDPLRHHHLGTNDAVTV
jgi:hypothetical protein